SVKAYDGITLDLQMPDQRGLGVLASIRSHGPSRESPVVGMTVPAQAGGSARFAIANVLCKPIRSEEVALAMARFNLGQAGGCRVMVIDDDPLSLDVMRATLANIGIEAVCVADGRTALRDIDKHRPDAIVLDLMMPEFDGFAVLDVLRQLPKWRETPVFIWTSMLLTEEEYASLSRSAQLILSKGGGALASMLEGLRQWRPPVSAVSSDGGGA
ncbi:MAG: luxQ 1, partial [Rhizobacter sp.]|nr:luxQ 1 [Rhizobacter sp.]